MSSVYDLVHQSVYSPITYYPGPPVAITAEGTSQVLSPSQVLAGIVTVTVGGESLNLSTPSASSMLAEFPYAKVGYQFILRVSNNSASNSAIDIVGGSGVTVVSPGSVAVGGSQDLLFYVTDVASPAITVY